MKKLLLSVLLVAGFSANAAVISMGSSLHPAFTYSSVNTLHGATYSSGSGYESVANATSTDFVAYNPYEASPSTFTWASAGTFDLNDFIIAGAWGSQTLSITGYNGNSLVGSAYHAVTTAASTFTANWSALTHFIIETGTDYVYQSNLSGSGQHWALNDIRINESVGAVPIPAAVFLFAPALLGFLGFRRKAKAAT